MDKKDNTFENRQQTGDYNVDENGHSNHGPGEECPVKVLRLIVWIVQDDETLDDSARKDATHSEGSDPCK